jgi:hypothetical protein
VDYDWSGDDFLASFDKSGTIKWSNVGYYAQIATSDGGVIGQSYSGQSYTFDANGNSTGQTVTLNPPSNGSSSGQWPGWLGNVTGSAYSILSGSAFSLASPSTSYATTYAALLGGNHGGTGTSVQQEWFPDLPSCPGASTPCAKEALTAALDSLRLKLELTGGCPKCQSGVFSHIPPYTQSQFATYLSKTPRFYDGTRSNAPTKVLCGNAGGIGGTINFGFCLVQIPGGTVSAYMSDPTRQASAVSQTPTDAGLGMMTFFDPVVVCNSKSGQQRILNEALLFHEGLHGYTGLDDNPLLQDFGKSTRLPSVNITYYIQDEVLGGGLTYTENSQGFYQCPN